MTLVVFLASPLDGHVREVHIRIGDVCLCGVGCCVLDIAEARKAQLAEIGLEQHCTAAVRVGQHAALCASDTECASLETTTRAHGVACVLHLQELMIN